MTVRVRNLAGVFTALVTPFSQDGAHVDYESMERLLETQRKAGVSGVVVCGSTGEAATLTDQEYVEVASFVRTKTKGSLPCIAGISVSATARAVEMARNIEELGCDGVLIAPPPYNKPTQTGIVEHFRAISRATALPLIAYNIPGRSGVPIAPTTLGTLSREGLIVGIKESSGSIDSLADTMNLVDPSCQVVSGDDSLTLAVMAYGGVGTISAAANVLPHEIVRQVDAWNSGRAEESRAVQLAMLPKLRALFIESNPIPAKAVLAHMGILAHPTTRLPLTPLLPAHTETVLREFGL